MDLMEQKRKQGKDPQDAEKKLRKVQAECSRF